jgi:hypothetical protein
VPPGISPLGIPPVCHIENPIGKGIADQILKSASADILCTALVERQTVLIRS